MNDEKYGVYLHEKNALKRIIGIGESCLNLVAFQILLRKILR